MQMIQINFPSLNVFFARLNNKKLIPTIDISPSTPKNRKVLPDEDFRFADPVADPSILVKISMSFSFLVFKSPIF